MLLSLYKLATKSRFDILATRYYGRNNYFLTAPRCHLGLVLSYYGVPPDVSFGAQKLSGTVPYELTNQKQTVAQSSRS
eukprot:scaffold3670_cov124-Cylindrotheca_fusiformis.AAC.32